MAITILDGLRYVRLLQTNAPGTTEGIVEGLGVRGRVNMPMVEAIVPIAIVGGSPDESHLGTITIVDEDGTERGTQDAPLFMQLVDDKGDLIGQDNPLWVQSAQTPGDTFTPFEATGTVPTAGASFGEIDVSFTPPQGALQWRLHSINVQAGSEGLNSNYAAAILVSARTDDTATDWEEVDAFAAVHETTQVGAANAPRVTYDETSQIYSRGDPAVAVFTGPHRDVFGRWTTKQGWRVGISTIDGTGLISSFAQNHFVRLFFEARS